MNRGKGRHCVMSRGRHEYAIKPITSVFSLSIYLSVSPSLLSSILEILDESTYFFIFYSFSFLHRPSILIVTFKIHYSTFRQRCLIVPCASPSPLLLSLLLSLLSLCSYYYIRRRTYFVHHRRFAIESGFFLLLISNVSLLSICNYSFIGYAIFFLLFPIA